MTTATPLPLTVPPWSAATARRTPDAQGLAAAWLDARDDVATALRELPAGTSVPVRTSGEERAVVLQEAIPLGHKFAVHGIGPGRRVRKYGEYIGRTTRDVPAGACVHVHNLATTATRSGDDEHAWRMQAAPEGGVRVLPGPACGEGASPAYDERSGRLYWLDVEGPVLHVLDLARGTPQAIALPRPAHVMALLDDGAVALVTSTAILVCDPVTGTCSVLGSLPAMEPGLRCTGAAYDAQGRVWLCAGDVLRKDRAGHLVSLPRAASADGALALPTGIAATDEGRTLLVVDAARACIGRCEVASGNAGPIAVHPLADAGALPGDLWGAALDADGGLWCALRDAGCVLRFARDGALTRVVRVPAARPTGCAFAGPALRELVVTTAGGGNGEADGRVLALDVGVAGAAARRATRAAFAAIAAS